MADFGNDFYVLEDEQGNEVEYEMIDALEMDDKKYVALLPAIQEDDDVLEEDYQIVILRLDEEEEFLYTIDDEEEFNKVWAAFEERLSEYFDIVD